MAEHTKATTMRRMITTVLCITAVFAYLQCMAEKKKSSDINDYELPVEMAPAVKEQYEKICSKGKILYSMSCGKCHNSTVKKKEIAPDFTQDQISGYDLRMGNAKHEGNLGETQVTAEELAMISTYLIYKKKSGIIVPHKED